MSSRREDLYCQLGTKHEDLVPLSTDLVDRITRLQKEILIGEQERRREV